VIAGRGDGPSAAVFVAAFLPAWLLVQLGVLMMHAPVRSRGGADQVRCPPEPDPIGS
jgi:hypothetical protein